MKFMNVAIIMQNISVDGKTSKSIKLYLGKEKMLVIMPALEFLISLVDQPLIMDLPLTDLNKAKKGSQQNQCSSHVSFELIKSCIMAY